MHSFAPLSPRKTRRSRRGGRPTGGSGRRETASLGGESAGVRQWTPPPNFFSILLKRKRAAGRSKRKGRFFAALRCSGPPRGRGSPESVPVKTAGLLPARAGPFQYPDHSPALASLAVIGVENRMAPAPAPAAAPWSREGRSAAATAQPFAALPPYAGQPFAASPRYGCRVPLAGRCGIPLAGTAHLSPPKSRRKRRLAPTHVCRRSLFDVSNRGPRRKPAKCLRWGEEAQRRE